MLPGPAGGLIPRMENGGHLFHNLLLFGRLLHGLGLDVNPGRMVDLVHALEAVGIRRRDDVYFTMRTLLVRDQSQQPLFDAAFDEFWRRRGEDSIELNLSELVTDRREPKPEPVVVPPQVLEEAADGAPEDEADEPEQTIIELTLTYSQREVLRRKDFAELSADELAAVRRLMQQFVWRLGERRTRRLEVGRDGRIDLRRTLRGNLKYGDEIIELRRRTRRIKPRPLVIIADVSGSMEGYTRLLLNFVYTLAGGLSQRVEAFVFSTHLTRITWHLRHRELERALADVSANVTDWSGGTRIGDVLKTFNYQWGRRVLRGGAVVLLISDGWDRGDPALLGREMERLNKTCHRLVWLNPLLGSTEYEPLTRGMVAALPHIDDFLPVHNLASLEDLADHLSLLDARRRRRKVLAGSAFIGR